MPPEAPLRTTKNGLVVDGEGWFVVNARESRWRSEGPLGAYCTFEGKRRFPQLGINVSVLGPGEAMGRYHRERAQEGFLVLAGECLLIVEEQERRLTAWDFFHSPAGTEHIIVGAGSGPCVVVAVGARGRGKGGIVYPASEMAARHRASVARETTSPSEAYAEIRAGLPRSTWVPYRPGWLPGSRAGVASAPDAAELLAAYDAQLRGLVPDRLPPSLSVERDGPLVRLIGEARGFVGYRDLGGLEGPDLDDLIARQVRLFAERGEPFEWKLHGHDSPADLPQRLLAAGFVPEEEETVVIAPVGAVAAPPQLPEGVTLREATTRGDLDRIAVLQDAVWGGDHGWLVASLEAERDADPEAIAIVVAEAGDEVVCAGWVRFQRGTDFATLWGGSTLPAWRRRGIYRATVAYRASLAAERGFRFLEVDASDDSRPILGRLGFVAVTTTVPYVWSPPRR